MGLLLFAYHVPIHCLPCPGALRRCWFSFGVAGDLEDAFKHVLTALRDHGPRFAHQEKVQNKDGIHSTHCGCSGSRVFLRPLYGLEIWAHKLGEIRICMSLPIAYHVFTIALLFATCPELIAKCEGSRFGAAAVCIPFPYQLLTMSLAFLYQLLRAQN